MLVVDILGKREEYKVKASSFPSTLPEVMSVNAGDTFAVSPIAKLGLFQNEAQIFKNVSFHWGLFLCPCSYTVEVGLGYGSQRWLLPLRTARLTCSRKKSSGEANVYPPCNYQVGVEFDVSCVCCVFPFPLSRFIVENLTYTESGRVCMSSPCNHAHLHLLP